MPGEKQTGRIEDEIFIALLNQRKSLVEVLDLVQSMIDENHKAIRDFLELQCD